MKRIIRLTESDLTRIVRRVINESTFVGQTYKYGGSTWSLKNDGEFKYALYGNPDPFKWTQDEKTIAALNKLSGYEIPTSTGKISVGSVERNKANYPNLYATL